eukprot:scaffold2348_cov66-Phaeocystis_antarctica.AAC.2
MVEFNDARGRHVRTPCSPEHAQPTQTPPHTDAARAARRRCGGGGGGASSLLARAVARGNRAEASLLARALQKTG